MSETNEKDIVPVNQLSAENYICDICHELFENPKHTLCGHTFCDLCIKRELPIRSACPTCRRPISISDILEASIILKKELAKIEVYCVNRCGWTGEKGDLKNHLANECESQLRPCPNSKILDFPACQEQFLKSTIQSHLDKCLFKSLKPFVTALAASCSKLAQQAEESARSLKNMTEQCSTKVEKSEKSVKELQDLVEQCHLSSKQSSESVSELKKLCNHISESIIRPLPLPTTPAIPGYRYIGVAAHGPGWGGCGSISTSVKVPGCRYLKGCVIEEVTNPGSGLFRLERMHLKECMAAVNIIANLGYSLAGWSWEWDKGLLQEVIFWMEYTEWNNGLTPSDIKLPPYILIWNYCGDNIMEPTIEGCTHDAMNYKDAMNFLTAKQSYRMVQHGYRASLFQICASK